MKARFSEDYYKENWERFIKETHDGDYINLEEILQYKMSIYSELPQEAFEMVEKIEAKKIADKFTAELKERMKMVSAIESGKSGIGYTTQIQENREKDRIITRFEFNCYQLTVFKKKYI